MALLGVCEGFSEIQHVFQRTSSHQVNHLRPAMTFHISNITLLVLNLLAQGKGGDGEGRKCARQKLVTKA